MEELTDVHMKLLVEAASLHYSRIFISFVCHSTIPDRRCSGPQYF
jgi:hypothetical protein